MKRTNKIILISVLVSLLLLGIGYAAIQNITLSISGFAELEAKADNFKVIFSETVDPIVSDSYYMIAERKSDVEANMKLQNLSKAGETVSVIYTIENKSTDLSADLVVSTTNDTPEYITVNSELAKTSIVAGEETTVEVTVTVTKTPIADTIAAKIGLKLIAMPVQPGEEGSSEGIKDPVLDNKNEFGFYFERFYYSLENGDGTVFHADGSAEYFYLLKKEEHPELTNDEWFCSHYSNTGEVNFEEAILSGYMVKNEGKTIVDPYGIEYTMSNIIPHGVYIGNQYAFTNEEENTLDILALLDYKTLNIMRYDAEGTTILNDCLDDYFSAVANGYAVCVGGETCIIANVSGDKIYDLENDIIYIVEEIHNYNFDVVQEATCTTEAEIICTCTECDKNYVINMAAHNHRNDIDLNSICDDCGETIKYSDWWLEWFQIRTWVGDAEETKEGIIPKYFYEPYNKTWGETNGICEDAFWGFYDLETIVIPDTVIEIRSGAFEDCYSLKTINYTGTQEQWEAINIGERNDPLINATINFNYVLPTE